MTQICSRCHTASLIRCGVRQTKSAGLVQTYRCSSCGSRPSARTGTAMHRLRTPAGRIASALNARGEGCGLRATARLLRTTPKSVARWEARVARSFRGLEADPDSSAFSGLVEMDEVYTRVHHNRLPDESPGWMLEALHRPSRFWLVAEVGRRDGELFRAGCERMVAMSRGASFVSDGERRYAERLWPLLREPHRTGARGRPPLVWPEGVRGGPQGEGEQSASAGEEARSLRAPRQVAPWDFSARPTRHPHLPSGGPPFDATSSLLRLSSSKQHLREGRRGVTEGGGGTAGAAQLGEAPLGAPGASHPCDGGGSGYAGVDDSGGADVVKGWHGFRG